jgi:hypothetical protein
MRYLGGCDSFKEKYKLQYECECDTKDKYYAVCCNYVEPESEGDK